MGKPRFGAIKMICSNPNCINKSEVWRKESNFECRLCHQPLRRVQNKNFQEQDKKAKAQLRQFGVL